MNARAWCVAAALALAGLGLGCGKEAAPTQPQARLGPAVEAVFPAARATRVPIDVVAWARFRAPLDPATVIPANVSLRLDAARVPVTLEYDATTRTLTLRPQTTLRIRRTYTVEFDAALATADGVPLDSTYFWQFTTTSVRRPGHPVPADGAVEQAPYAVRRWDATESSAGAARYDVYTGDDSAAVAARRVTPRASTSALVTASVATPLGATVWWAVDVTNLETGEQASGPLWHYTVAAPGAPVDSLVLPMITFAATGVNFPTNVNCRSVTMTIGGRNNAGILWDISVMPADIRIAGARLVIWPQSISANTANTALWGTLESYDGCAGSYTGAPLRDVARGPLAAGIYDPSGSVVVVRGDPLVAHLQAAATVGGLYGYSFTSDAAYTIYSPNSVDLRPILTVYYYRGPTGGAAATSAPTAHARATRE
jgi:hypothetical protein